MKIVVTGSEGFIGSHLCARLVALGHAVTGFDLKSGNDVLHCALPDADRVVHLAAQTDAMSENAEADARANVMGLLRVLSRYGSRVVFASSSMVHHPVTPYAISKLAGEHYARFFGASIVRFCNVYGPGGHSLIDRFETQEELTIRGDGSQVRTFAPVDQAIDLLVETTGWPGGLFRVLQGADLSVLDVAALHPEKCRRFVPSRRLDLPRVTQAGAA